MSSAAPHRRDAVVNLRMSKGVRDLIDEAAAALGKTRTDFIIDSSRKQATDVLLDQRLFALEGCSHHHGIASRSRHAARAERKAEARALRKSALGPVSTKPPVPLDSTHDVSRFDCGKQPLNDWLKERALQSEVRSVAS